MSFATLREILLLQPSAETWNQLTTLFETWQGDDLAIVISYRDENVHGFSFNGG